MTVGMVGRTSGGLVLEDRNAELGTSKYPDVRSVSWYCRDADSSHTEWRIWEVFHQQALGHSPTLARTSRSFIPSALKTCSRISFGSAANGLPVVPSVSGLAIDMIVWCQVAG
jgi:hypothetical protein